jgi:hypothetical protein
MYKTECFGCFVEMELEDKHPEGPLRTLNRMALHLCESCLRAGPKIHPIDDKVSSMPQFDNESD